MKVVQDTLNQKSSTPVEPPPQQEAGKERPRTFRKVAIRKMKDQQQERSEKGLTDTAEPVPGHQGPLHKDAGDADELRVKAVKVRVKRPEAARR